MMENCDKSSSNGFPKFIVGLIEIQSNIRNLGNMGNVNRNADVNDKQAENKVLMKWNVTGCIY